MQNQKDKPDDGPAVKFLIDPHLSRVLDNIPGSDFSMVTVTMWPPPLSPPDLLLGPYTKFIDLVRECFEPEDLAVPPPRSGGEKALPSVYLYPPETLHVTVTTLQRFDVPTTQSQRDTMTQPWRDLLRRSTGRPDWPRSNLKLRLESAQIGDRAGILLWRETTGALARMRECIGEELESSRDELAAAGVDVSCFRIPNIIHSTFLRFASEPKSAGEKVQKKFAAVVEKLPELFSHEIECETVRLVCERRPYMHIPFDEAHVFDSFDLV